MSNLKTKPGLDADRKAHQTQVKHALINEQAFGLTYILTRLKSKKPYDNYQIPSKFSEFEFSLKGAMRLEMMENQFLKSWRRLLGSNTKAADLSSWRSRVLIKAFDNLAGAMAYVEADPLLAWEGKQNPWPGKHNLPPNDWYVFLQIQDVYLNSKEIKLSDLLVAFYYKDSQILQAILPVIEVIPAIKDKGATP